MNPLDRKIDFSDKKSLLLNQKSGFERAILEDIGHAKEHVGSLGRNALWIAGGVVLSYYLITNLFGGKRRDKQKRTTNGGEELEESVHLPGVLGSIFPTMAQTILMHMAEFLISIAKEKLLNFLEQLKNQDESKPDSEDK